MIFKSGENELKEPEEEIRKKIKNQGKIKRLG